MGELDGGGAGKSGEKEEDAVGGGAVQEWGHGTCDSFLGGVCTGADAGDETAAQNGVAAS